MKQLIEHAKAPTPKFFKKLRTTRLILNRTGRFKARNIEVWNGFWCREPQTGYGKESTLSVAERWRKAGRKLAISTLIQQKKMSTFRKIDFKLIVIIPYLDRLIKKLTLKRLKLLIKKHNCLKFKRKFSSSIWAK